MNQDAEQIERLLRTPDRDIETLADFIDKSNALSDACRQFRRENGLRAELPEHLKPSTHPDDVGAKERFTSQYISEALRIADIAKGALKPSVNG